MYYWYWIKWIIAVLFLGALSLFLFLTGPVLGTAYLLGFELIGTLDSRHGVAIAFLVLFFIVNMRQFLITIQVPWVDMMGSDSWKSYKRIKANEKKYGKRQ